MTGNDTNDTYAIETSNLTYRFSSSQKIGLDNVTLKLEWGSCNLVIGPNGAGKSTLLRILAGKTLIREGKLKIGGFDPFKFSTDRHEQHNSDINNWITYLGTEWAGNPIVKRDISVSLLIQSIGGDTYPEKRDELIEIMDIDTEWSMAYISDGERRRVQLVMGLLKPWKILLLDEVTVDLDVVVRQELLNFLRRECKTRSCCIVYATHIFDGLDKSWCDRIIHLSGGSKLNQVEMDNVEFTTDGANKLSDENAIKLKLSQSLHPLALGWLRKDMEARGTREQERQARTRTGDETHEQEFYDADSQRLKQYFKATRGPS